MLGFLKNMFTSAPGANYSELIGKGAKIIDVRSPEKFRSGTYKVR